MKKWFDSPKYLFALLQVASVLAMAVGVWMTVESLLPQVLLTMRLRVSRELHTALMLLSCGLWLAAWLSFLRMCGRLRKGGTAFTPRNSRTLKTIGACVLLMGALQFLHGLPGLIAWCDVRSIAEAVILPGVLETVGAVAFILSRLLDHAMALEAEQADVI